MIWSAIPIVLEVNPDALEKATDSRGRRPRPGTEVALWSRGRPVAFMAVGEVYRYDRKEFARQVYGTLDPAHPGVARVHLHQPRAGQEEGRGLPGRGGPELLD